MCVVAALGLVAVGCSSAEAGGGSSSTAKGAAPDGATQKKNTTTTVPGPVRSAGCKVSPPVAPGQTEVHLDFDGQDRWSLQHIPPGHDGTTPLPVVIDLHGYAEGAALHTLVSGMGAYGDSHGFVTISPQGQGTPAHWNANLGTDDVALIGKILDDVEAGLCVDTDRVYATGYSNGAFLTSVLACAYSDRIAAVAPVAGIRDVPDCTFERPVPVMAFHGTDDTFVVFNGGVGTGAKSLPAPDGSGKTMAQLGSESGASSQIVPGSLDQKVPDNLAAWAKRNGCSGGPAESKVADDVTLVDFDCPPDATTELYRVEAGGHTWPGSPTSAALASVTGRTTMSIDATALMWEFFQAHPLTHPSGSAAPKKGAQKG
jgi:polyhydroxybutyrate depolymerase